MRLLEATVGKDGLKNLIRGFLAMNGPATEAEITSFLEQCDGVLLTAKMIEMAADGELTVGWSAEDNDFVFGQVSKSE